MFYGHQTAEDAITKSQISRIGAYYGRAGQLPRRRFIHAYYPWHLNTEQSGTIWNNLEQSGTILRTRYGHWAAIHRMENCFRMILHYLYMNSKLRNGRISHNMEAFAECQESASNLSIQ